MGNAMILNDCGVTFNKASHTYKLKGGELSGVTGRINDYLGTSFKGKEKIPNVVRARIYGTNTHDAIEDDFNGVLPHLDYINEVQDFKDLCDELGLKMIASEYLVSDLDKYASCIDVTLVDNNNGVYLGDIKTPKKDKREYNTIQLSIYKYLFELVNPHLEVKGGVIFRINRRGKLVKESYKVDFLDADKVKEILYTPFNKVEVLPDKINTLMGNLTTVVENIEKYKKLEKELRTNLEEAFNEFKLDKLEDEFILISKKDGYLRKGFDKKRFESDYPELAKQYETETVVNPTLNIKLK